MDSEAFIRDCAKRGLSQHETRLTLGWSEYRMAKILSVMGPISWPARGCSLAHKRANEARRGVYYQNMALAHAVIRNRSLRTVDGITGTIDELAAQIGTVTGRTVRARMAKGMTLELALKTPRRIGGNRHKTNLVRESGNAKQ